MSPVAATLDGTLPLLAAARRWTAINILTFTPDILTSYKTQVYPCVENKTFLKIKILQVK